MPGRALLRSSWERREGTKTNSGEFNMDAATNGTDTVVAERLQALTRDEPDLTALVQRLQQRSGTTFGSSSAWQRDASGARPRPTDQRVANLRGRLRRSFG
jgi:hypothetical protein